jgi:hypothetical protein
MIKHLIRLSTLLIALAFLAALPAAAQVIPKGVDYWVTPPPGAVNFVPPADAKTQFTFPDKDVESLCHSHAYGGTWNHQVTLQGVHAAGVDWDSAVARLDNARFNRAGDAFTRVQFKSIAMASTAEMETPCGKLKWTVRLAKKQPITKMKIHKATAKGGLFYAPLALRVEMRANKAGTGAYLGSLFYDIKLDDPPGGTGWSFGPGNAFRPGVDENDKCLEVLRKKLQQMGNDPQHFYYISNLIAHHDCNREPN